ncbi:MAG: hypothetical protein AAFQ80_01475 [Cyanobacteria bacterium J06621_8]
MKNLLINEKECITEVFELKDGSGTIKIIGDKTDSAIFLNGEMIHFTYLREYDTIQRYQIAQNIDLLAKPIDSKLQDLLKNGNLSGDPLSIQFKEILKFLENGKYYLILGCLHNEIDSVKMSEQDEGFQEIESYGGIVEVIETQSFKDQKLIAKYKKNIINGMNPIVILLMTNNSDNIFILDGHHKYEAYVELKKKPKCLIINRIESEKIDQNTGKLFLQRCNKEYWKYYNRYIEKIDTVQGVDLPREVAIEIIQEMCLLGANNPEKLYYLYMKYGTAIEYIFRKTPSMWTLIFQEQKSFDEVMGYLNSPKDSSIML